MDECNTQVDHIDNLNLVVPVESSFPTLLSNDHLACLPRLESNYLQGPININSKQLSETEVLDTNILDGLPSPMEANLLQHEHVLCEKAVECNQLHSPLERDVKQQVFSEVIATISDYYCQLISENQLSLMERLQGVANVRYEDKENNGVSVIRGDLQQILQAQRLLETYVEERRNSSGGIVPGLLNFHYYGVRKKSSSDKGVMCDIIKLGKLSHFAMEHPRQARFSSLLLRQTTSRLAVKEKFRFHRRSIKRRKVLASSYTDKRLGTSTNSHKPHVNAATVPAYDNLATPVIQTSPNEAVVNQEFGADVEVDADGNLPPCPPSVTEEKDVELLLPQEAYNDEDDEEEEETEEDLRKKNRRSYEEMTPFKFFCKRCSFKTKRESHYAKHLGIHDKVKTLYNCESCSFTTIRLSHLRRHEMSHSQTTYNCDQCTYKTDEMKLLSRHIKLKHKREVDPPSPVETFQCNQCPYKTTKSYHYKRHLKVHNNEVKSFSRVYQCDQCTYKTNRKEHYIRHVNNVHSNKRPYLCDFCGKAFKRPDALKQHRITHGSLDSRTIQFKCSVCQKKCRSQAHLNEHQAVHSNIRMFLCEICGASFKTRSVQRKHIITIHKNPRAHPCEHCDKRFNTNYALRRHLRLHLAGEENLSSLTTEAAAIAILDDTPSHDPLVRMEPIFSDQLLTTPANTLSVTLRPTLSSVEPVATVSDGGTLITIQESFDQVPNSLPQGTPFIQTSEATTALLYLTANFTQF